MRTQVVQDVQRKRPVACTEFVDLKVFVWKVLEQVFRDETLSDSLAIPWLTCTSDANRRRGRRTHLEQLSGRVPDLPPRPLRLSHATTLHVATRHG